MELYLVRHGETEWSRARRHTGRTDLPLSAAGEAEAAALGRHLRGLEVDRVLSSPLTRAVDHRPAGRVRRPGRDAPTPCSSSTTASTRADHRRDPRHPARVGPVPRRLPRRRDGGGPPPSGPGALLAELGISGGRALLFSHGHQLRILTACFLGLPPDAARHLFLGTASLSVLGTEHEWPAILLWNEQEGSGAHIAEAGTTGWRGVPG